MTGVLEWDLAALQRSLHLTDEEVRAYFTDGRRVSFLLERRLMREVLGGRLARSEGNGYDVLDRDGRKWEVRSVSKGGIYFCPSYMVGSGRSFNCDGFLRKLDDIHGYAISDITGFPRVPYWLVTAEQVRNWWNSNRLGPSTQISREKGVSAPGSCEMTFVEAGRRTEYGATFVSAWIDAPMSFCTEIGQRDACR